MTPEEQRIAIAEACGWVVWKKGVEPCKAKPQGIETIWQLGSVLSILEDLPDYLNDLNAMDEAEMTLWHAPHDALLPDEYIKALRKVCQRASHYPEVATATLRAEAFLRTLNLYTEQHENRPTNNQRSEQPHKTQKSEIKAG